MPLLPGDESVNDLFHLRIIPNLFEVIHLDHIGPLTKDDHGYEYILVLIDSFHGGSNFSQPKPQQRWKLLSTFFNTSVDSGLRRWFTPIVGRLSTTSSSSSYFSSRGWSDSSRQRNSKKIIVERAIQEVLRHLNTMHGCSTLGHTTNFLWFSVL